ncbi:hypothetical protein GO730_05770 [Spirosoma sp. HMF3257]|uniref:Uncharacterized protein n=1 Tax=Spirosoma telluris TaxID=2183553 RepID=A0A327NJ84_9BACT|nr:hypothetical protein [Spirosoma telluris]RAI73984.1 hypothetical protein HMF3257_05730 [Spirosoma telluris]
MTVAFLCTFKWLGGYLKYLMSIHPTTQGLMVWAKLAQTNVLPTFTPLPVGLKTSTSRHAPCQRETRPSEAN